MRNRISNVFQHVNEQNDNDKQEQTSCFTNMNVKLKKDKFY